MRKRGGDQVALGEGLQPLGDSKDQLVSTLEHLFTFTYSLLSLDYMDLGNMMYFVMSSE